MTVLFPIAELAMIATSFTAMGAFVAYSSWKMRREHLNDWRDPFATRRRK